MRQWTCFKEAKEQYFTYLRAGCLNVYRYGTGLICKDNVQKIVPDTRHCKWNATFPTRWLIQSQQREQKTGNLRDPLQQLTLLPVWISTTNLFCCCYNNFYFRGEPIKRAGGNVSSPLQSPARGAAMWKTLAAGGGGPRVDIYNKFNTFEVYNFFHSSPHPFHSLHSFHFLPRTLVMGITKPPGFFWHGS